MPSGPARDNLPSGGHEGASPTLPQVSRATGPGGIHP